MKKPFTPNRNGVVVVKLTQPYSSNVPGETAGFLPEIAKALVRKGIAVLPGQEQTEQPNEAQDSPEMTTRKFRPVRDPLDHDGDGKKGGSLPADQREGLSDLRAEYKGLTGADADGRWSEARLKAEIEKAKDPSPVAAAANV